MYYIFHGDDELRKAEELNGLRSKMGRGEPSLVDLNTSFLDGRQLTMGELRHVCDSVPFFGDRRLVIVKGLLGRLAQERRGRDQEPKAEGEEPGWKRSFVQELKEYLPKLPKTTRLVFVETKKLDDNHPILKLAQSEGASKGAYVKLYDAPSDKQLPVWIQKHAREKGGTITSDACELLAALIGNDLWLLDLELEKLLLYAEDRQVTVQDVQTLVSRAREMSVFDLVDQIGHRRTDQALKLLHALLEDEEKPLGLLAMLGRQVRILIQVGELRAQRLSAEEIAKRVGLHPFVVSKALDQIQNFTMEQLEEAHQQLVNTDWAIKTGEMDESLALYLLVVALTQPEKIEAPA